METLKQQILAKDPGASLRAKQLGRPANPMLLELMKDPDADVRRVTLYCLKETGGPETAKQFVASLTDEDPQVAGVAVDGANKMYDPAFVPQYLQAYDQAPEGFIRGEIALLAGRSDKTDPKELLKRETTEQDPAAQEGLLVALSRLGDKPHQQEFVRRLQSARERTLRRFLLVHGRYINQPWLLKPLLPLLDAKDNLVHYGVDARPDLDLDLRTSDVTVFVVAAISQRKFTFKIDEFTKYTDAQIDEVRKFLKGLP